MTASLAIGMVGLFGSTGAGETARDTSEPRRFAVLENFEQEAVLDLRTQLIWERSPNSGEVTWSTAQTRCGLKIVGGQDGWRLPTFIELMTLIEPAARQPFLPALPAGHPFHRIKASAYWTSDASSLEPGQAYTVDLLLADVSPRQKTQLHPLWCVRGGVTDRPHAAPVPARPGLI